MSRDHWNARLAKHSQNSTNHERQGDKGKMSPTLCQ